MMQDKIVILTLEKALHSFDFSFEDLPNAICLFVVPAKQSMMFDVSEARTPKHNRQSAIPEGACNVQAIVLRVCSLNYALDISVRAELLPQKRVHLKFPI